MLQGASLHGFSTNNVAEFASDARSPVDHYFAHRMDSVFLNNGAMMLKI